VVAVQRTQGHGARRNRSCVAEAIEIGSDVHQCI
jgi:hypothetical protein